MIKYVRNVQAIVVRKGITNIGGHLGDFAVASRGSALTYALEIQSAETAKEQTIYLDFNRSKDFYRIPIDQPLILGIGRDTMKVGYWLDTWSLDDSSKPVQGNN